MTQDSNELPVATILESRKHPFTLRFESETLEQQFADSIFRNDTIFARAGLLLAIFIYVTFAVLDLWIVPEFVSSVWGIRVVVVSFFSVILGFTFTRNFRRYYQMVQLVGAVIGGIGVVAMVYVISVQEGYLYYVGLILAFIFYYTTLGLRFINAFSANILVLLVYNLVLIGYKDVPVYMIVNNNYFLVGSTIVFASAGYILEQQRRLGFLKSLLLEDLRKKADDANVAKSRFFAGMSHELRTPLNAIIGYSELLLEDEKEVGNVEKEKDLVSIQTAGKHLLRLINNVLDMAKIEAGKIELVMEEVPLSELVQRIEATASPLAAKNHNRLRLDINGAPAVLYTDSMRLEQVLINLLSNACKFTENGEINLVVSMNWAGIAFSVRDTGIGMTHEQVTGLFDEYTQADASISRDYGGTGLGLAISKQLVELMGGSISVVSEAGRGSTFTVTLPLSRSPA